MSTWQHMPNPAKKDPRPRAVGPFLFHGAGERGTLVSQGFLHHNFWEDPAKNVQLFPEISWETN